MEDLFAVTVLTLLWGIGVGILVSAPMGPTGILVIQRTLNKGWLAGFFTGIGAVFSDLFYAILSTFAVSLVVDWIDANQIMLFFVAGILIACYGVYLWRSNPASALNSKEMSSTKMPLEVRTISKVPGWSVMKFLFSGFGLTVSNPFIVVYFLTLFSRIGFIFVAAERHWGFYILFFICIACGAVAWWLLITWLINKIRNHFRLKTLRNINRSIAIVMFVIALWGVGNGVYTLCCK
ncbi:MAG: LysE family translocator [Bacteroidales bacterium]|nr:LysE family translocator [Bacteroidales bacterium]